MNPATPTLLAVAAQQFVSTGYDQNKNYVYVSNTAAQPPLVKPLDAKAPVNIFAPRFQGRAPTWSPDGNWIAFESSRNCADKDFYAIFVEDGRGNAPASQITACGYNAQHAKWYRLPVNGRTLLIVTARLYPDYIGQNVLQFYARGIASLDVTPFVTR